MKSTFLSLAALAFFSLPAFAQGINTAAGPSANAPKLAVGKMLAKQYCTQEGFVGKGVVLDITSMSQDGASGSGKIWISCWGSIWFRDENSLNASIKVEGDKVTVNVPGRTIITGTLKQDGTIETGPAIFKGQAERQTNGFAFSAIR